MKRDEIKCMWQAEWKKDCSGDGEDWSFFNNLFLDIYNEVCEGAKRNKDNNFHKKKKIVKYGRIFSCVLLIIWFILKTGECVYLHSFEPVFAEFRLKEAMVILAIFSGLMILFWIKDLDVKKYQETWVRHEYHRYLMEEEMLRFIYYFDEYRSRNRKSVFVHNILRIWRENEIKYVKNMEEKEKPVLSKLWVFC